jgi:hypothetical protein
MSVARKRTRVARQVKYSTSDDFFRRILSDDDDDDDDDDDEGGAGVREPRRDRPSGPGPVALALSEADASEDVVVYASEQQQPA